VMMVTLAGTTRRVDKCETLPHLGTISSVYLCRSTEDEAMAAKQMTMNEARRVASNIAKLPEMLKRGN
jgi:hypothetical protein